MEARWILFVGAALGVAAAATVWGGEGASAQVYRQALVWGWAVAVAILARALLGRLPAGAWRGERGVPAVAVGWGAAWLILDLGPIGAGYLLGWTTFTFGDQRLEAAKFWLPLWALPLALAAGLLAERALRAGLLRALAGRGRPTAGALVSAACGVALALPALLPGGRVPDPVFLAAALVVAAAREAALVAIYRRAGLPWAGGARGILLFVDAYALNDWYAAHFPAAQYVSSEPAFYLLRALGAVLGAGLLIALLRRRSA